MFSKAGFSLIEVLVAMVIGLLLVLPIGVLTQNLSHQQATSDELSSVTSLAEQQIERLLALPSPSTDPLLASGTHGPLSVDTTGNPSVGGPYQRQWVVVDDAPAPGCKKITVTCTHTSNSHARCALTTYCKVS